jgi:ketosteroid isomerase-like protein
MERSLNGAGFGGPAARSWLALAVLVALALAAPSVAQKDTKRKKDAKALEAQGEIIPATDNQAIESGITEMLGAWQIGETELLHKHYADDVVVVSGVYEPPLIGWANYLQAYQRQRERTESVRVERFNTVITVRGTYARAAYQWEASGVADGRSFGARGHTTLVLEKRGDRWLIVHNHTSIVEQAKPKEVPTQQGAPAKPGT